MKIIGLTGNIASGKSSVSRILINKGIPVVDVDLLSCVCFSKYPELVEKVSSYFGESTITSSGDINHEILDLIIISSSAKREALCNMVYPFVRRELDLEIQKYELLNTDYLVVESSLIVETGLYKEIDKMIYVTCPTNIREKRLIDRNQIDHCQATAIAEAQIPDYKKIGKADYMITNDGSIGKLIDEVENIWSWIDIKSRVNMDK